MEKVASDDNLADILRRTGDGEVHCRWTHYGSCRSELSPGCGGAAEVGEVPPAWRAWHTGVRVAREPLRSWYRVVMYVVVHWHESR